MDFKEELQELIEKARIEDSLLYQRYTGIYFTPNELEQKNKMGQFVWGVCNWELVPREKRLGQLKAEKERTIKELEETINKLKNLK
jgi:hypothetical protein